VLIQTNIASLIAALDLGSISRKKYNNAKKGGARMSSIQPLGDRVLVKALEAEEKTKSGIVIPDSAKEKPQEGEVIAVGKGRMADDGKIVALEVKKGDRVLYGKYSGTEVTTKEGDEYLIMKEDDILAIVAKK
jgi:chaperonin GroES